jgi:hypothetical protein
MHLVSILLLMLLHPGQSVTKPEPAYAPADRTRKLYDECGLHGLLPFEAFSKCIQGYHMYKPEKHIVAICDFTKESDKKRFIVLDLDSKKVISQTYVAHGVNSGDCMATSFSNEKESLKSSLGFFRIGSVVQSSVHGPSLLLDGLEKGINDNAREREIIIHSASYVGEEFVQKYGYTGHSHGCPALPAEVMPELIPILSDGGLLYIYGKP